MKIKKLFTLLMLCAGIAVFAGCSQKDPAAADTDAQEELKEYVIDGVGTLYLPEGFSVESGVTEEGLPMHYAELNKDSLFAGLNRFGTDAYEAAGVPIPEDLDDYSTRAGVRQGIPEDAEFTRDSYDNLFVKFSDGGETNYQYLKKGTDSYGAFIIICPEGEEDDETFALWASKVILE